MFLKGNTVSVTRSPSGIGLAGARAMAAEGANVMLNVFGDAAEIEGIRVELEQASGGKALYNGADLTKADQIEALMEEAAAELGGVDKIGRASCRERGGQYV